MGFARPNDILAAVRIDPRTDTIENSFGIDVDSFTTLVAGASWEMFYAEGVSAFGEQSQLFGHQPANNNRIVSATGLVVIFPFPVQRVPGITVTMIDPQTANFGVSLNPIVVTVQNIFQTVVEG